MFYIYILYSESFDKYYVGYTSDITRRLEEHNTIKFATFTHKYRPWSIAALFEVSNNRGETMKLEKFIKKQKSVIFLKKLIDPDIVLTGQLSGLVRVPKLRD